MEITVLMPCLNEEETLEICIRKAKRFIERNGLKAEILVADNGSTDNSIVIAQNFGARVIRVAEKGYGMALRRGIESSLGDFVIMGDSDDSYDFDSIEPFIVKLREGYDLVIGNRFQGGINDNAMPFLHRYLGNPVLSFIARLFFRVKIGDFHCGLRAMNRQSILKVNFSTTGMEFASEMIVKSSMMDLKITEVPTKLYVDGRSRPPHLRTWQDGWRHLRFLLMYCPRWLFLYPGLLFLFTGLIGITVLAVGSVKFLGANFDISTMLFFSCLIIIGWQVTAFYLFIKLNTIDLRSNNSLEKNRTHNRLVQLFSLEKGLKVGGILFLIGLFISFYSLNIWTRASFGDLQPDHILRIVIPAVTCLILGTQTVFNSFFISMIGYTTIVSRTLGDPLTSRIEQAVY